jgi:hypothetical protein
MQKSRKSTSVKFGGSSNFFWIMRMGDLHGFTMVSDLHWLTIVFLPWFYNVDPWFWARSRTKSQTYCSHFWDDSPYRLTYMLTSTSFMMFHVPFRSFRVRVSYVSSSNTNQHDLTQMGNGNGSPRVLQAVSPANPVAPWPAPSMAQHGPARPSHFGKGRSWYFYMLSF